MNIRKKCEAIRWVMSPTSFLRKTFDFEYSTADLSVKAKVGGFYIINLDQTAKNKLQADCIMEGCL